MSSISRSAGATPRVSPQAEPTAIANTPSVQQPPSQPAPTGEGGSPTWSTVPRELTDAPRVDILGVDPDTQGQAPDLTVARLPHATVLHGTDPGDFYCEHMFFSAQQAAAAPGSQVATNAQGERLVGFLHTPADPYIGGGQTYTQAERHQGIREVVGAAIRGYYPDAARAAGEGPVRILLTGYGAFGDVVDNPTGDFVSHQENIDAAMGLAFGAHLLTPQGEPLPAQEGVQGQAYRYRIRDPATGDEREIIVHTAAFPVEDAAIDPSDPGSIHRLMSQTAPHAVLSMGYYGGETYLAEHHADDGGLAIDGNRQSHDWSVSPSVDLPDNFALARAISRGAAAQQSAVA